MDEADNLILVAKGANITWSLANLFNPGQNFKKIKVRQVEINIARDQEGLWNYSSLFKVKPNKQFQYKIANLSLPELNLNLEDKLIDSNISFKNISLLYQEKRKKKILKLRSDQSIVENEMSEGMSSQGIADLSHSDLCNLIDIDSVSSPHQFFGKDSEEKYKIRIINLDPINVRFLLSLIDLGNHPNLKEALNRYAETVKLTVISDLEPDSLESNAKLKVVLTNLVDIPELKLVSNLNITDDLKIQDLHLSFDKTDISLKGEIKNWKANDPPLELAAKVSNLNIKKLRVSFAELERAIPDFFLEMLSSIGVGDNLHGDVSISSKLKSPIFDMNFPIDSKSGEKQSITVNSQYFPDRVEIKESSIPMDFSALKISGSFLLDESDYDLRLEAEDLPVLRLRNLFVHLPILRNYKNFLMTPLLSGYTSFSLNAKPNYIKGNVKLAKANYYTIEVPVKFEDLNADIDIENTKLIVNSINSKVDGSYLEARAGVELNQDLSKLKYEAEIASPKMNLSVINHSRLLELSEKTETISLLKGFVQDFYLSIKKTESIDFTGKMKLDGVSLRYKNEYDFKDLRGSLVANAEDYSFENLSLIFNDSSLELSGRTDKKLENPKLELVATQLDFAKFMGLVGAEDKWGIAANKGLIDASLSLNGAELVGNGSLTSADFFIKKTKKLKYPFINITTDFEISKDLNFNNLSGNYGSSSFTNSSLEVKNYKISDKSFDLDFNGSLVTAELESLMPKSVAKFITTKGALPVRMTASGNSKKSVYDVEAQVDQMESFKFAEWLDVDRRYALLAKAKFTVTPQLIFSDLARIISSQDGSETALDASFQVQGWNDGDDGIFSFNTATLGEGKSDLGVLGPHIVALKPLNLDLGMGTMDCDTRSNDTKRQTLCQFFVDDAIAYKYGIGDLKAKDIRVDLISITNKPLDVQVRLRDGDWNGIDYKKIKFDLKVYDEDMLQMNNLKANLPNYGNVRGNTKFNFKTLESEFFLRGNNISANQLVNGIWGFGVEVPEGYISGIFKGKTKGLEPDDMFFNMEADTDLIVRDGKLSSLKTMQKILSAVNTMKNFDFNNVFQTLITYKGGLFNYGISSLNYDHGRISSEKLLLKAEEIELNLDGFVDYSKDQLSITGEGLIPKRSKSILQTVGVGNANLGNLLSLGSDETEKNFFEFTMIGPVSDMDKTVESVKSSFEWVDRN